MELQIDDLNDKTSSKIVSGLNDISYTNLRDISKIPHSTSTINYKLEFAEQDPLLLRIYPKGVSGEYEYTVLKKIYNEGIRVPNPRIKSEKTKHNFWIIMEFIDGPVLGELIFNENVHTSYDYLSRYIDQLISIHKFDWQKNFSNTKISHYKKDPHRFNKELFKRLKRGAKHFGVYKKSKPLLSWVKDNIKSTKTEDFTLLHGDYHPFNNIMYEDKIFTIDWEAPEVGDNRYDLAFAIITTGLLEGKKTEQKLLELYDKNTEFRTDNMEFYYVTTSIPRIVKLHSMQNNPNIPEVYNHIYHYLKNRVEQITDLEIKL